MQKQAIISPVTPVAIDLREVPIRHRQLADTVRGIIFKNEAEIRTSHTSNEELASIAAHLKNYHAKEGCGCKVSEEAIEVPLPENGWIFVSRTSRGLLIRSNLAFRWSVRNHDERFVPDMKNIAEIVVSLEDLLAQVEGTAPGERPGDITAPVSLRTARA